MLVFMHWEEENLDYHYQSNVEVVMILITYILQFKAHEDEEAMS